jgi:CO dehydrogenase maturation factor
MAKIIAMAGKGGTGKTTLAALIVRSLLKRDLGPVLAVDGDPNATLPEALGLPMPTTIGEIREQFGKASSSLPAGMNKTQWFEYQLNSILVESDGFDLLVMGRQEGPGCYCYVNNLLRGAVESLSDNYRFVVIDNEAGLEHLSRRTAGTVDLLVVVSDHSVRGVRSAHRVQELADEMNLDIADQVVLVNRAGQGAGLLGTEALDEPVRQEAARHGLSIFGVIPPDDQVTEADLKQEALLRLPEQTPAGRAADRVIDHLLNGTK